jgi:hypothetical protein
MQPILMLRLLDKPRSYVSFEQGGQLIEKQEAEVEEKYRRSELEAQEHSQYAGKFKSAEDLEKAYLELQKKLGQKETDDSSSTEENESDDGNRGTRRVPGNQTCQLPKGGIRGVLLQ